MQTVRQSDNKFMPMCLNFEAEANNTCMATRVEYIDVMLPHRFSPMCMLCKEHVVGMGVAAACGIENLTVRIARSHADEQEQQHAAT